MRKTPNKKLIGLFAVIGISIFIGTIMFLIGDKIVPKNTTAIVLYFSESIKGLNVGAPVLLKGVKIGKVARIDLVMNLYQLDFEVPVIIEINSENFFAHDRGERQVNEDYLISSMIEKGLRARLISQSIITGQLAVELEILPKSPIVFHGTDTEEYIEIPTVLSQSNKLLKSIEDIHLKESIDKMNAMLDTLNIYAPNILIQIEEITTTMNKASIGIRTGVNNPINNFNKTLQDIGEAARSFRNLTDYIERNPESILRGKEKY